VSDASVTTAAIIRYSEDLEDSSSSFYRNLAERWPQNKASFLDFAEDGQKNKKQVVRTYQETISDAYEASNSLEGLDLKEYAMETKLVEDTSFAQALEMAISLEDTACGFYAELAARSESLLATIPRAFKRVVKNRSKRKDRLERMLQEAKGGA
jgi:rubrerythrin